jgi:hypothetical protein
MSDTILEAVRDAILLEVDWHNTHAIRLELWAKQAITPIVIRQLNAAAFDCRQRAQMLNAVLVASDLKKEAETT